MLLENFDSSQLTFVVTVLCLLYAAYTTSLVQRKPRLIWIPASFILLLAFIMYWVAYGVTGVVDGLPRIAFSVRDALNLFLFNVNSTYGRFTDYFYLPSGVMAGHLMPRNRLICLTGLSLCAMWTTCILLVHFLARRVVSVVLLWWRTRSESGAPIHLFLGANPESLAVASSLGQERNIVFVDLPAQESIPDRVSFFYLFRGLRSNSDMGDLVRRKLPHAMVLKARKPLDNLTGKNLFRELGLPRLKNWARQDSTVIYLLSENYAQNLAIAQKLSCYNAQVYCHAKREGLALYVELSYPASRLHIVDSSYLATKALKLRHDLYPVHLVDVATDKDGNRLAYVESAFHALLIGFGESGQGALSFLYEFAAFPDKDKNQSPFLCDVLDRTIEQKEGRYMSAHPGMDRSRINFISGEFGTTDFWNNLRERIAGLNYIFISLGSDRTNVQAALDLLAFAYQYRPNLDKLLILAKTDQPSAYREMVDYYNENYGGSHCVHLIGDIRSTWTWDNISGNNFRRYAKVFYTAYAGSSGDSTTWEEREARIMAKTSESDLSRKQEVLRKNSQDQTNYFHMQVKKALAPEWMWKDPSIAAGIPVNADDGKHYLGDNPLAGKILDYLAVGEHLRWRTSHEAAGYRRAENRREDMKTHPDIRPYTELTERVKHYDWVVVKTTLELLGKEQGND